MSRPVVPIAEMNRRLPELGRIRTGAKTERAMKALSTFRFTSSDQTALGEIAALYGGTVRPWSDPKASEGQYEVITEAAEITVALPPDPLGGTPVYELWGGGGCERRCDGVTCETWVKGPDGPEPSEMACVCDAKGELACDPKTRLNVILPNVRGIGTWRLETKSWNAAQELPGMVDLIQSLQAKGITRATLRLEHKRSTQAGVTRKYIVPVLGLDSSVEALMAGEATVGALGTGTDPTGTGTAPALPAGGSPAPDDPPVGSPESEEPEGVNGLRIPEGDQAALSLSLNEALSGEVVDAEVIENEALGELRAAIAQVPGLGEQRVLRRAQGIAKEEGLMLPDAFGDLEGRVLELVYAEVLKKLDEA